MKVYIIGAGPGAPDLITVRGAEILSRVSKVLYAGSLVPEAVLKYCAQDAEIVNTAELNLEEQIEHYISAREANRDVARVHSGDPAIYGATAEQMSRLAELGIDVEIVPGVSSFSAAAAAINSELTKPNVSQTIILTRVSGRASAVPDRENLASLAQHQCTLCIFLSGPHLKSIVADLSLHYTADTPVALVYRATWPDERIHRSTLGTLLNEVTIEDWKLTTMLLVGKVLDEETITRSKLYSEEYSHKFRRGRPQKSSEPKA